MAELTPPAPQMFPVPLLLLLFFLPLLLAPGSAAVAPGVTGECQPRAGPVPLRVPERVPAAPGALARLGRGGKAGGTRLTETLPALGRFSWRLEATAGSDSPSVPEKSF